jgi:hypothetical protein
MQRSGQLAVIVLDWAKLDMVNAAAEIVVSDSLNVAVRQKVVDRTAEAAVMQHTAPQAGPV